MSVPTSSPAHRDDRTPPHAAPEVVEVTTREVMCEGSGGALGHPRVYLPIGPDGFVDCPYCDRRFMLHAAAAGHPSASGH